MYVCITYVICMVCVSVCVCVCVRARARVCLCVCVCAQALQAQFEACLVKDIIHNVIKHGAMAPQHHRIQMLQDEKRRAQRKEEVRKRLRGAGRAVMMSSALEDLTGAGMFGNRKKKNRVKNLKGEGPSPSWIRHGVKMVLPMVVAPPGINLVPLKHYIYYIKSLY
jgi:hypothetical protein